jgi:hypothetical protein
MWVFAADVTSYVTSGANTVSGFASGYTNGGDPWSESLAPLADGASLVVLTTGATSNNIYLYTGTYTEITGGSLTSVFNHGAADATTASITFIVLDGQLPGNTASYNGGLIDSNAFPGSDPKTSTTPWSFGTLSDTKTYSVTEALGATTDSASIAGSGGDCLTWAAQVISIPSTAPVVPILPTPVTGVPQFSASPVMVAAVGAVLLALLLRTKQSLKVRTV